MSLTLQDLKRGIDDMQSKNQTFNLCQSPGWTAEMSVAVAQAAIDELARKTTTVVAGIDTFSATDRFALIALRMNHTARWG